MATTVAQMVAKINTGTQDTEGVVVVLHQVSRTLDETAVIWASITDHPQVGDAVQSLRLAQERLEEAMRLIANANVSATSYAANL